MYDIGKLYEADSIDHAIKLLNQYPEAEIIAGGSDVLVQIREGKRAGGSFISIYSINEMRGVEMLSDGCIRIGSLTSFSHITASEIIKKHLLVLGEAVDQVGSPQIRNIGTIGGNTCNGVTSADSASTLTALDAEIEVRGMDGTRIIPIKDWYIKAKQVNLNPGELQVAIRIPKERYEDYNGYYIKYGMRNSMEIATLGVSVNVKLSKDKTIIEDVRIGVGVAAPVPIRAVQAEALGQNKPVCQESVDEIGEALLLDINPRDSWRAGSGFRKQVGVEMAKRALKESIIRSGGKI